MQKDYKDILLSPIKVGTRTAKNRFFIQAIRQNAVKLIFFSCWPAVRTE